MRACVATLENEHVPTSPVKLIQANADVDLVDDAGLTALHHAARSANYKAVAELINRSAGITVQDPDGVTPLCSALEGYARNAADRLKYHTAIGTLLDADADPQDTLPDGTTALHCVAELLMDYSNDDRESQIEIDRGRDHFTKASALCQRCIDAGCDRERRDNKG